MEQNFKFGETIPFQPKNYTLIGSMDHSLETGQYSDIAFVVGEEQFHFNVHKVILGGRSDVFSTMMEKKWTDGKHPSVDGKVIIPLPEWTVPAFRIMVKYLYTDELNKPETLAGALTVLEISHFFRIPPLLDAIKKIIKDWITPTTALEIYKNCRLFDEELTKQSFQVFIENIRSTAQNDQYLTLDVETIREILNQEIIDIKEVDLFKALLKWANQTDEVETESQRNKDLKELIKLIRFPTMELKEYGAVVVKSGIFSDAENLQLFMHFANPHSCPTEYKSTARKNKMTHEKLVIYDANLNTGLISEDNVTPNRVEIRLQFTEATMLHSIGLHHSEIENFIKTKGSNAEFVVTIQQNATGGGSVSPFILEKKLPISNNMLLPTPTITLQPPLSLKAGTQYDFQVICKPLRYFSNSFFGAPPSDQHVSYVRQSTPNILSNSVKSFPLRKETTVTVNYDPNSYHGNSGFGFNNQRGVASQWIEFLVLSNINDSKESCNIV